MPNWTAFGTWPSNAQGHFECSYTYVIQRLALWQNDMLSWMFDLFFIATVAYPSNSSICNASCMFQMIWWHLLLSMLCAHTAFPSTGDATAALELLHQSQVKVTIKTGAQILCSLSSFCHTVQKIAVGVATGSRSSPHTFLKSEISSHSKKDKMPKEKCSDFGSHLFTDLWQHGHNIEGTHTPTWVWHLQETASC